MAVAEGGELWFRFLGFVLLGCLSAFDLVFHEQSPFTWRTSLFVLARHHCCSTLSIAGHKVRTGKISFPAEVIIKPWGWENLGSHR